MRELQEAGYQGPVALRVNPGFGHGHVKACDTGGPSSKHGIWPDRLIEVGKQAEAAGMLVVTLHAHVGTGSAFREFDANMKRLTDFLAGLLPGFGNVKSVNLGGGIPHPYQPGQAVYDLDNWYRPVLVEAVRWLFAR